jgi:TorA maturation chaperone TorD
MSDTETRKFILFESARCAVYKLLAASFYLPEKAVLEEENVIKQLTLALQEICPGAAGYCGSMSEALRASDGEELKVEYSRLFVGPYELKAPPYGSVYLDKGRRTMGDSTLEVQKIYREAGLVLDEDFKELPDHIATELEFMYYLGYNEVKALESSDIKRALELLKVQQAFTERFLRKWVPPFTERIEESTESEYYSAIAGCLRTFVLESDRMLGDLPKALKENFRIAAG